MKSVLSFFIRSSRYSRFILLALLFAAASSNSCFGQTPSPTTAQGTDFWFGYTPNSAQSSTLQYVVYITSFTNTSGTITIGVSPYVYSNTFTVTAGVLTAIALPLADLVQTTGFGSPANQGVHITALAPITVHAAMEICERSENTEILPTAILGNQYYVMGDTDFYNFYTPPTNYGGASLLVVAQDCKDSVEIIPSNTTTTGQAAGVPFTAVIEPGQVFLVQSAKNLTGSMVKSLNNSETAVMAGDWGTSEGCGNPSSPSGTANPYYEEMFPVNTWGQTFVFIPTPHAEDHCRILAEQNNTVISLVSNSGTNTRTLNAGQVYDTIVNYANPIYISATNPVSVGRFLNSSGCNHYLITDTGDPSEAMMESNEQMVLKSASFYSSRPLGCGGVMGHTDIIDSTYVTIVTRTPDISNVSLDGTPVAAASFATLSANTAYSYAALFVSSGAHEIATTGQGFVAYYTGLGWNNAVACDVGVYLENITATITNIIPAGCAGANGSATVTATGITGLNYLWSDANSQTTATATGLSAGTYTVTVSDSDCVPHIDTAIAIIPGGLSGGLPVTITEPAVLCYGGTTNATANITGGLMPYTYLWAPGGQTTNPVAITTGTYTVSVTDNNGCSGSATTNITQPPLLTATMGTPVNGGCSGANVTVTTGGGTPNYSYLWNDANSQTTATANNLAAGNYTVTVTDMNSCTATASVNITQPAPLTATITSTTNPLCNGGTGSAMVSAGGGTAPYTYLWNPGGQTNANATGLIPASYTVTVTDANTCTATATTTITEPSALTANATNTNGACAGNVGSTTSNPSGGTSPYTYLWSSNASSQTTASATGLSAGNYTVTVTDNNGCTSTGGVAVPAGTLPLISLTSTKPSVCYGFSAILTATVSNDTSAVTWNPGNLTGISVTVSPTVTTTYTASVSNHCGSASATITIQVNNLPDPAFKAEVTTGCYPLCIQFTNLSTISPGTISTYEWNYGNKDSTNAQNPSYCYPKAGMYSVSLTATSDSGCSATLTKQNYVTVYTHPNANFIATPQPTTILQPTITFTDRSTDAYGLVSWNWTFGDESDSSSRKENTSHTYKDTGTYCPELIVMNNYGCTDSITNCIVIDPIFTLYIPSAFSPNGDGVNDVFQPKGNDIRSFEMYVFDRWGVELFHTINASQGWDGSSKGVLCPEDAYVYVITVYDNRNKKYSYTGTLNLLK